MSEIVAASRASETGSIGRGICRLSEIALLSQPLVIIMGADARPLTRKRLF